MRPSGPGRTDGNTACWPSAGESLWLSSWKPSKDRPSQAVCGAGLVCRKWLLPFTVLLTLTVFSSVTSLDRKIWVVRHSRDCGLCYQLGRNAQEVRSTILQLVCVFAQVLSLPVVATICLSTCGPLLLLFGTVLCVDFRTGACHIVETVTSSFGFYSLLRVPTPSNYSVC